MKKKVLIIGASGFLGSKLFDIFSSYYNVNGTCFERNVDRFIHLDITDESETKIILEKIRPDIVILAGGMTDVDRCQREKELAKKINVYGTENVISAINKINSLLVYISTDVIFDGKRGNYNEEDVPKPLSYYGRTKYMAERLISSNCKNHLICRVAVLYGYNGNNTERSFAYWAIENLKANRQIDAVTDIKGTPTLIDDIANALILLINKNRNGIYHVSGPQILSRYDMAVNICHVYGFDAKLVKPIVSKELIQDAPRPKDTSLNTEKLKKEGILMHDTISGLNIMKGQMLANGAI